MTKINIFVCQPFLSLHISDFSYFSSKSCIHSPHPRKKNPSFPATLSKNWDPVKPPPPPFFSKFDQRLNLEVLFAKPMTCDFNDTALVIVTLFSYQYYHKKIGRNSKLFETLHISHISTDFIICSCSFNVKTTKNQNAGWYSEGITYRYY